MRNLIDSYINDVFSHPRLTQFRIAEFQSGKVYVSAFYNGRRHLSGYGDSLIIACDVLSARVRDYEAGIEEGRRQTLETLVTTGRANFVCGNWIMTR